MFDAGEMLEEIRRWVAIESPTRAPAAVGHLMELVESEFRALGARTRRIPGRDGYADHLEVTAPWGGDGPGILILSHLDTVHPLGTLEDRLPFRIEGDRAFGPGIYDMKGGAYLGFAAFRALVLHERRTPLPLRWIFTGDEEVGSPTSRDLVREAGRRAKYVLVTEPARDGGKCVTARKGVARFTMRLHGRPAHSGSRHGDGRSAVRELAHQILALEGFTDYARGITVNVGMVSGGTAVNVVPEHAEAAIDLRVPRITDAERLVPRFLERVPVDPDVTITVEGGLDRPPYEKTPATAALFEHARGLAREIGFELEDTATGGGSDGNFLADRLPVLDGLGVDGDGAHTMEEHLLISSLVPRATLLLRLFETLR